MVKRDAGDGRAPNRSSSAYKGTDGYWHGRVSMGVDDLGKTDRRHVMGASRAEGVCCIERSQVIFAGRFAVVTSAGAPAPVRCGLVSTGWWHSEGLPAVGFPVKITSDHSMQQTP